MIVAPDIEEGVHATVDPSSSLFHQIFVTLHRICAGECVCCVMESKIFTWLAVDTKTKDSILGQIHVGLAMVTFLNIWIEHHFEVAVLE